MPNRRNLPSAESVWLFLNDENSCSEPVIFVEKELQIIQKVYRTAIFNAATDCCGALHLKNLSKCKAYKHSAALPLFSFAVS